VSSGIGWGVWILVCTSALFCLCLSLAGIIGWCCMGKKKKTPKSRSGKKVNDRSLEVHMEEAMPLLNNGDRHVTNGEYRENPVPPPPEPVPWPQQELRQLPSVSTSLQQPTAVTSTVQQVVGSLRMPSLPFPPSLSIPRISTPAVPQWPVQLPTSVSQPAITVNRGVQMVAKAAPVPTRAAPVAMQVVQPVQRHVVAAPVVQAVQPICAPPAPPSATSIVPQTQAVLRGQPASWTGPAH